MTEKRYYYKTFSRTTGKPSTKRTEKSIMLEVSSQREKKCTGCKQKKPETLEYFQIKHGQKRGFLL